MKITTAEVRHRNYVPFGYIAFEFCNVYFRGSRAEEMEKKWSEVEGVLYAKHDATIAKNEEKIKRLRSEAERLDSQMRNAKPFFRFWYSKEEEELLSRASRLFEEANELERRNERLSEEGGCSVYETYRAVENLLEENNFVKTQISSTGGECPYEIELWKCEE